MMTALSPRIWTAIFIGVTLSLAACSAPVTVAPPPPAPVISGKVTRGVIAAVRPVGSGNEQASIQTGFDGVFAALQASPPQPAPVNATEYVVQRSDATTVSIVTQTGNFSIGDRVEIIDGAPAELIHGN